jgi:hypothetical protein
MKAMLLAVAVIVVVIGVFTYVVCTDPNRAQTRNAFALLHETSSGVPQDPAALGYLNLKTHSPDEFNHMFTAEQAMQRTDSSIVEGAILKQEYLLRQAEYELAQIKSVGGDITSAELEEKRSAYANATKRFQAFWDTKLPTK